MHRSERLPARFPTGAKYVVEGYGPLVRRYVEFPDGRKVQLAWRKAQTCSCAKARPCGSSRRTHSPSNNCAPFLLSRRTMRCSSDASLG